jgi:hypothetical protein
MGRLGDQYVNLPKPAAVDKMKKLMKELVPCIGQGQILSKKPKVKKEADKHGISITELIDIKTRFPTLVIPLGKDGSTNHAIVVIDDLIFDSTQVYALKLCRDSLDWICGNRGIASIDVAICFNRSNEKNLKPFGHQLTTNW